MADFSFNASERTDSGKKYSKNLRRKGLVPGVVYGPAAKPQSVEFDVKEMELLYRDTLGKNALLTMKLAGKEQMVMFKSIQREPVKSKMLHVDFYHVDAAHPLNLDVPIILDGISIGVKEGGILSQGVRSIHVRCLPDKIPAAVHVNISELKMEENILLQSLTPPEGVIFLTDAHAVLAHVSEVKEEEVPTEEEAAAVAGDVKEGDAKEGDAKEGDAKAGDAKAGDAKAAEKKGDKK
jgi:large subunit ribosomal protein L25